MIAEGNWKARATEAALGFSSKGTQQVAVDLVLLEGDDAGKHITWYGYFSDATFERTIESLRTLGWEGDDLSNLTGIDKNDVYAVIEHEDDLQGQPRARVKWINGSGGLALKERMDAGQAKAFAAQMKGRVLALKQKGGAAAPKPPSGGSQQRQQQSAPRNGGGQQRRGGQWDDQAPPPSDSDIPF